MPADGYIGAATLVVAGAEFSVDAELRGHFQPIDGHYHWYGRIAPHPELSALVGSRKTPVQVRTAEGAAAGDLSDPDPWGRYRILGTSTPPFAIPGHPKSTE